jgi:hypothetical protein
MNRAGKLIVMVGGVIVLVSSFLNWTKAVDPDPARSAFGASAKFLIDHEPASGGITVGIVVFALGALAIASPFLPAGRIVGLLAGLAAGGAALLFVFQMHELIVDRELPVALSRLVAVGPYVAAAGGAIAVIGSVIQLVPAGFWARLTTEGEVPASAGQAAPPSDGA